MLYCKSIKDFNEKLARGVPLLGVDCGTKKVGVSVSDPNWVFSMPYTIIHHNSIKEASAALIDIALEKKVTGIVFGYPLESNGDLGKSCKMVDQFIEEITKLELEMPYFLQDERFTTKFAEKTLMAQISSKNKSDGLDDSLAASYILQTALDLIGNSS